jgi:hypothetical protein
VRHAPVTDGDAVPVRHRAGQAALRAALRPSRCAGHAAVAVTDTPRILAASWIEVRTATPAASSRGIRARSMTTVCPAVARWTVLSCRSDKTWALSRSTSPATRTLIAPSATIPVVMSNRSWCSCACQCGTASDSIASRNQLGARLSNRETRPASGCHRSASPAAAARARATGRSDAPP